MEKSHNKFYLEGRMMDIVRLANIPHPEKFQALKSTELLTDRKIGNEKYS